MLITTYIMPPLLVVVYGLGISAGRRIGPEVYKPDCKKGTPQKQKDVRSCCLSYGIDKKCRRLCSTNRHNHAFEGALLCSFSFQHIIDACHCGVEPIFPPRKEKKNEGKQDKDDTKYHKLEDPHNGKSHGNITVAALRSDGRQLGHLLESLLLHLFSIFVGIILSHHH